MAHVIGTAGHVDHGKSALVEALTGIDPDRLADEKARGMTIDLGFAWTRLPSGREVGFVDVPGHERFVRNMLAGAGGIDCALLVVDATEGWRAQSTEHLAILDLLGVPGGVVALTKADLVDAPTLGAVRASLTARLAGSVLEGAEVVATSARTGQGLQELLRALDAVLDRLGEPADLGRPRLPVDRVFSVRGSGTVVTGTLQGGVLQVGADARILPHDHRVRLRGLQSHGQAIEVAAPVRRVAVNVAGVAVADVRRGDAVVLGGQWRATRMADVQLRCLASAAAPLRSRGAFLLYAGTAERLARLQPLDVYELAPGQQGLVRIHLDDPLVLDSFEAVVLRDAGRDDTVAGGRVLDPHPSAVVHGTVARVRRVEELEARAAATRLELVGLTVQERGLVARDDLPWLAGVAEVPCVERVEQLTAGGSAVATRSFVWSAGAWHAARTALLAAVDATHERDRLSPGMPRELARQTLRRDRVPDAATAELLDLLVDERELVAEGPVLRRPGQAVQLDDVQRAAAARVEAHVADGALSVLTDRELADDGADRRLIAVLVRAGTLTELAPGRFVGSARLAEAVARLRAAFPPATAFSATQAKELLGTTRKTAIPLLEHLDRRGVTIRNGDTRTVRSGGGG